MPMQPRPSVETVSGEVVPRVRFWSVMPPLNPAAGNAGSGRAVEGGTLELGGGVRPTDVCAVRVVVGSGDDRVQELLRVVLRVVPEGPAGLEVPPRAGVAGDPVEDGEPGSGRGQGRLDHPHAVVVREPRRQVANRLGPLEEGADPAGHGVDAVPVGVEAHQGLGGDLAHAVEGVRPGAYVDAEQLGAGRAADRVVGAGVHEPAYVVLDYGVEEGSGGDHVG